MSKLLLCPCALAALSVLPLAGDEKEPAIPERAPAGGGTPAAFSWADIEGDGRLELAAVSAEGVFQLLAGAGEGRFEDISARVGLAGITKAALAQWVDYDADGRVDLFVGARAGASRLFRNEGGSFVDMTAGAGLSTEGGVFSADWVDHDGDGRTDLHVVTAEGHELYRGLEGGFFERAELPPVGAGSVAGPGIVVVAEALPEAAAPGSADDERGSGKAASIPRVVDGPRSAPGHGSLGPPQGGLSAPITAFPFGCATSIKDQANPGTCLMASTTPTLGRLYPLSTNLFVALSGDVGIGTTSPAAKLHVAGTARISDTLTLAPSGDMALDVSTGSIYKSGAPFIHTKGSGGNSALGPGGLTSVTTGSDDTAMGANALSSNTTGSRNTAIGSGALAANTVAFENTAIGAFALQVSTTGYYNTAVGHSALRYNITGDVNTAVGCFALENNTGSNNTAVGLAALRYNTTGISNTASGLGALHENVIGNYNTASGAFALLDNSSGSYNTATGASALSNNSTGSENTATGRSALRYNTTGSFNSAAGRSALLFNTTGSNNTAQGVSALRNNTTASGNTAHGSQALFLSTGANNTASGFNALRNNTTGSRNIALGRDAGYDLTTGSDNIVIGHVGVAGESATIRIGDTDGTQTRAFIAGIHGVTVANSSAVLVNSAGQLGTVTSSRRFKQDIADMGDRTERLLDLRPVVFHYKEKQELPDGSEVPLEYGLIAEEVAEIFPELVVFDEEGQPFTVKYHLLSAMLLNELQNLHEHGKEQARELAEQARRLDALESRTASGGR